MVMPLQPPMPQGIAPGMGAAPMMTAGMPAPMTPQPAAMAMNPATLMGGGPDILSMLNDPMVLMLVLQMMNEDAQRDQGPMYEKWYRPEDYPRPKVSYVIDKTDADKSLYQPLVRRMAQERLIYLVMDVGRFPDFDHLAEITFTDPSLAQDSALVVNLVATTDTNFEARARRLDEAEIAEKKEQIAHAALEKWERRHQRMYGTSLRYDEAKTAITTGHLAARFSCDFDAESDEVPVNMDLLDPATCFPTWDGERGMRTMTRKYRQTLEQVIATWATKENKLEKKLMRRKVKDENGRMRVRTLSDTVDVHEYWDRRWYVIAVDGEEALTAEHKYGCVPFEYIRSPFGDSGVLSLDALTNGGRSKDMGDEIAMKGLSHIWASKITHSQREAIMGRLLTELKKTANPDRTFEQAPSRYGETPQVTNAEGGISLLVMGEEREVPGPQKPGLSLVGPLMGTINEGVQRSLMPASAYGVSSNANESGTAIEGLNEAGRDKLTAWLEMLERWDQAKAEKVFRFTRDHGRMLGSEGRRGYFEVPRQKPKPGQDAIIEVTPQELRQVGLHIRAKRTSLRLSNLGNLGNAIMPWIQGGMMEKVEALEMRGVQDPIAALERIRIEQWEESDVYKNIGLIKYLEKQGKHDEAIMARTLVMQGGGGGGGPMGAPPSGPPIGGPPGGPGVNGGAPPGVPMGPQGASSPMGALGTGSRLAGPPPGHIGAPPGAR
jgi:hypothetical protein